MLFSNSTHLISHEETLINETLQETPPEALIANSEKRQFKKSSKVDNSWKPHFKRNSSFQKKSPYFISMNTGVGFLYFANVRGYNARITTAVVTQVVLKTTKSTDGFVYNRSPLFEGVLGWNITNYMALGLSVLHQGGVYIQCYNMDRLVPSVVPPNSVDVFQANISLDAVVSKLYLTLPHSLIWKTIAYTPYFGVSLGPSWQTWSNIQLVDTSATSLFVFRQKISANCFVGTEAGFKLRSLIPNINLSIIFGCKFNLWGQARSMGKITQQKGKVTDGDANTAFSYQYALVQPYSVRTVYQWAPFLGFSLAF